MRVKTHLFQSTAGQPSCPSGWPSCPHNGHGSRDLRPDSQRAPDRQRPSWVVSTVIGDGLPRLDCRARGLGIERTIIRPINPHEISGRDGDPAIRQAIFAALRTMGPTPVEANPTPAGAAPTQDDAPTQADNDRRSSKTVPS